MTALDATISWTGFAYAEGWLGYGAAAASRHPLHSSPEVHSHEAHSSPAPCLQHDGYLFFPDIFKSEEVHSLLDAVPALYPRREAYNVRERGSDARMSEQIPTCWR